VPQLHSIENVKVALIAYNTNIFHVCSANRPAKHYLILGDSTAGRPKPEILAGMVEITLLPKAK